MPRRVHILHAHIPTHTLRTNLRPSSSHPHAAAVSMLPEQCVCAHVMRAHFLLMTPRLGRPVMYIAFLKRCRRPTRYDDARACTTGTKACIVFVVGDEGFDDAIRTAVGMLNIISVTSARNDEYPNENDDDEMVTIA